MAIKQLSIFIENKQGTLLTITDTLAKADIDIRAISVADTQDFGILRLIVTDIEKAKETLEQNNCFVSITEVVGVAIKDHPGALSESIKLLTDNDINIEYMYAFISEHNKVAYVVLRVQDNQFAEKVLTENGIDLVSEEDIANL